VSDRKGGGHVDFMGAIRNVHKTSLSNLKGRDDWQDLGTHKQQDNIKTDHKEIGCAKM
jgi:hypothetical protein